MPTLGFDVIVVPYGNYQVMSLDVVDIDRSSVIFYKYQALSNLQGRLR